MGVFFLLSSACSDSDSESKTAIPEPPIVEASPLETENPEPQNPPILFQCVGENFDNSSNAERISDFDQELDLANWLYDGKTTVLSTNQVRCAAPRECTEPLPLLSSITKNEELATLSLRIKENSHYLFSVQQQPFHGFLQAGIRQDELGGWTQCQGDPEVLKSLQALPKRCFALWTIPDQGSSHFAFPLNESSQDWQNAFETANFQVEYRATDHFILYKLIETESELEMASLMTDRYFRTSRATFNFNSLFISIDCKSEDL